MSTTEQCLVPLHVQIPSDLKQRTEVVAKAHNRSLAGEVRQVLEERCREYEASRTEAVGAG